MPPNQRDLMEGSLYSFVIRHARVETALVCALTIASMPIYYLGLDVPKNLMNQAILGRGITYPTEVFGYSLDQVGYLAWMCAIFFVLVVITARSSSTSTASRAGWASACCAACATTSPRASYVSRSRISARSRPAS